MSGFLIPIGIQHFDDNGNPLNGGLLYAFAAGTSTPLAIYADQALLTPLSNPAVLSASGRLVAFARDGIAYKYTLKTSAGVTITGYPIDNVSIPQILSPAAAAEVPTGSFLSTGKSSADTGYLLCDGTAVSRTTYAALFAAIGTTYGVGNGSTTFNLPDFRGKFVLGKSTSGTGSALGAVGGTIDHTHTGPSHTHTVAAHTHTMAHTHTVERDNWGSQANAPGVSGRLLVGNGAGGADQPTGDKTTSAASTSTTSSQALTSDASGTGATSTANPPFCTVNWQVKM